jgi:hypothetical protein
LVDRAREVTSKRRVFRRGFSGRERHRLCRGLSLARRISTSLKDWSREG